MTMKIGKTSITEKESELLSRTLAAILPSEPKLRLTLEISPALIVGSLIVLHPPTRRAAISVIRALTRLKEATEKPDEKAD